MLASQPVPFGLPHLHGISRVVAALLCEPEPAVAGHPGVVPNDDGSEQPPTGGVLRGRQRSQARDEVAAETELGPQFVVGDGGTASRHLDEPVS